MSYRTLQSEITRADLASYIAKLKALNDNRAKDMISSEIDKDRQKLEERNTEGLPTFTVDTLANLLECCGQYYQDPNFPVRVIALKLNRDIAINNPYPNLFPVLSPRGNKGQYIALSLQTGDLHILTADIIESYEPVEPPQSIKEITDSELARLVRKENNTYRRKSPNVIALRLEEPLRLKFSYGEELEPGDVAILSNSGKLHIEKAKDFRERYEKINRLRAFPLHPIDSLGSNK